MSQAVLDGEIDFGTTGIPFQNIPYLFQIFSRVAEGTDNDIQRPLLPGFGFALFASQGVNALRSHAFGGCAVILPDVGSHGNENARFQAALHFLSLFINIRPQQHFYAAGKIFQCQNGEFSTGLADLGGDGTNHAGNLVLLLEFMRFQCVNKPYAGVFFRINDTAHGVQRMAAEVSAQQILFIPHTLFLGPFRNGGLVLYPGRFKGHVKQGTLPQSLILVYLGSAAESQIHTFKQDATRLQRPVQRSRTNQGFKNLFVDRLESSLLQMSSILENSPFFSLSSRRICIAPSPTFLMAASP